MPRTHGKNSMWAGELSERDRHEARDPLLAFEKRGGYEQLKQLSNSPAAPPSKSFECFVKCLDANGGQARTFTRKKLQLIRVKGQLCLCSDAPFDSSDEHPRGQKWNDWAPISDSTVIYFRVSRHLREGRSDNGKHDPEKKLSVVRFDLSNEDGACGTGWAVRTSLTEDQTTPQTIAKLRELIDAIKATCEFEDNAAVATPQ